MVFPTICGPMNLFGSKELPFGPSFRSLGSDGCEMTRWCDRRSLLRCHSGTSLSSNSWERPPAIKPRQVQTVHRSLQTALTASLHGHDRACTEGSVPDGAYFLYMETYMLLEKGYFPPSHKHFGFLY